MATGVSSWSQTAASNSNADANVNFAEGQAPSSVNDSARALMASVAKWRDDNTGALTTTGTSTAYSLSSNQGFATLGALGGQTIRATFHTTCGASPTLNVDGLGAKPIAYSTTAGVGAGDLQGGRVYGFVYDAVNSFFIVHGGSANAIPTGTMMLFQQTAAPSGWTKQTTYNNIALRVVSGTAGSGGTAYFTTVFTTRTITQANLPSYTLPSTLAISDPGHAHSYQGTTAGGAYAQGGNGVVPTNLTTGTATTGITLTGSVSSGGSGAGMDFNLAYCDVIIAQKN